MFLISGLFNYRRGFRQCLDESSLWWEEPVSLLFYFNRSFIIGMICITKYFKIFELVINAHIQFKSPIYVTIFIYIRL